MTTVSTSRCDPGSSSLQNTISSVPIQTATNNGNTRPEIYSSVTAFFLRDERGSAHSISLVLALPIYLFVSCFAIELTLIGVSHLALKSASDRATALLHQWIPHRAALARQERTLEEQLKIEISEALLPYAITRPTSSNRSISSGEIERTLRDTHLDPRILRHFGARWQRIYSATEVEIDEPQGNGPYLTVNVHLSYETPFWTFVIGRICGVASSNDSSIYVCRLKETVQVPVLRKDWIRDRLGIPFNPLGEHHFDR